MNEDFVNDKGFVLLPWRRIFIERGIPFNDGYLISVYPVLRSYANKDGKAKPSIATLATYSGVSKEHVLLALKIFEENGGKITRGKSNVYEIAVYSKDKMEGEKKPLGFQSADT